MRIHISGIIQGVGFRPFVYGLARRLNLKGWVRNTSAGVDIEVDGDSESLQAFVRALREEAPPLAMIDELAAEEIPADGYSDFEIVRSDAQPGAFQPISPDVSICEDCRRELFDPNDRRYRYPFINCTSCGPRFTIIRDIPYDRAFTTMAPFEMCPDCAAEYQDPLDRRFHAQPVACPACGPQVWLEVDGERVEARTGALKGARSRLAQGEILAIKGLGGFHLACDATNREAVRRLRERKLRVDKAFALMMPNLGVVAEHCHLTDGERDLLAGRERPILILDRRPRSNVAAEVAPGQETLGVMLAYTPLHELLLEPAPGYPEALVMTSGNLSEEPIATGNDEARSRLGGVADAFLMHDRDIHIRCDDSVARSVQGRIYLLRRARGFAPYPLRLPRKLPSVFAVGPELKNTFCLTQERYAFLSHHIGDMHNYETLRAFEDAVGHYERLFRAEPEAIACDLHPDYLSTRFGLERSRLDDLPCIGVQHHHAHIAACMADNGLDGAQPVIGVALDGTGYGEDGTIWGGEFLVADYLGYQRACHLATMAMPGGEAAVREPWRLALAYLAEAGVRWDPDLPPVQSCSENERMIMRQMLEREINAPRTSSVGRLFDAVSALCGVRSEVNYEAQAAIELEALADRAERGAYVFEVNGGNIQTAALIRAIVSDLRSGVAVPVISARFHNGLAEVILRVCARIRAEQGLGSVALSGGVWQNMLLLERTVGGLREAGFRVHQHHKIPANDGGVSLGQAMIAGMRLLANKAGPMAAMSLGRGEE
jgi:hydrogenase maturation protein HypF